MAFIERELAGASTVGITGHLRPDGDCTGSTLGLYNYIKENLPNIDVDIFLEPIENCFKFLKGSDMIHTFSTRKKKHYDVFVILDCGDIERTADFVRELIMDADKTICIDHHVTGSFFATVNHVCPEVSSASEVLYELLEADCVSKNVAECLYVGMIHDTGVFKYQSTTSRTMEIAGKFMDMGIDFTHIIDDTFFRKSYEQNVVMGIALINSKRLLGGKLIYSYMSQETLKEHGLIGRDTGGIIDQLRFTQGVEVAVFMYELPDGRIKTSLRSVWNVDVNTIANSFGGGGHLRASGFTTELPLPEIINKLESLVEAALSKED